MRKQDLCAWAAACFVLILGGCKSTDFGIGGHDGTAGLSVAPVVQSSVEPIDVEIDGRIKIGSAVTFDNEFVLGYNSSWNKKSPKSLYRTCSLSSESEDLAAAIKDAGAAALAATFRKVRIIGAERPNPSTTSVVASGSIEISTDAFKQKLSCGEQIDGEHHCEYRTTLEFSGVFDHPLTGSKTLWTERTFRHKHPAPLLGPSDCDRYGELAVEGVRSTTRDAVRFFGKEIRLAVGQSIPVDTIKKISSGRQASGAEKTISAETVFLAPGKPWTLPVLKKSGKVPGRYLVQGLDSRAFLVGLPRNFTLKLATGSALNEGRSCTASVDPDPFGKAADEFGRSLYSEQFESVVFTYLRERDLKRDVQGYDAVARIVLERWQSDVECRHGADGGTCEYAGNMKLKLTYRHTNGETNSQVIPVNFRQITPVRKNASCSAFATAIANKIAQGVRAALSESARRFAGDIQRTMPGQTN